MAIEIPPVAIEALKFIASPTAYALGKILERSGSEISESSAANLDELNEKAKRAEIECSVLLSQAKVEQELSIARRIMCAQQVEIEEYYDISGKGAVGVKAEKEGITFGASGEGNKVTKRIIKFSGFSEQYIQEVKKELDKIEIFEVEENTTK
ncbi:TPA: hypothetical protein ON750_001055 [Morganella morganii]|nr:hypothetical protein N6Y36_06185 [Morganella morganii]HCR3775469.1 hypothetical protein [Morganella morganii]HCT9738416.1 hypothetical protein [Morganella morganii]